MEKKLLFHQEDVSNVYNPNSKVKRVVFQIIPGNEAAPIDRSYYKKYDSPERSGNLGNVVYEERGYELLGAFDIKTPEYRLYENKGTHILALEAVSGMGLQKVAVGDGFIHSVHNLLRDHLKMWTASASQEFNAQGVFQGIRTICPIEEALATAEKIAGRLNEKTDLPYGYTANFEEVLQTLKNLRRPVPESDALFFQHGDEILDNFIYNPTDRSVTTIDPSPIRSTRMERALNKLLGGSLLFNFEIDENGIPREPQKVKPLIETVRNFEKVIGELNPSFGLEQQTILREITFINLSRVHFGFYNRENAEYFASTGTAKFLNLALRVYDDLSHG